MGNLVTKLRSEKDFFRIQASRLCLDEIFQEKTSQSFPGRAVVFQLQRSDLTPRHLYVDGESTPLAPFPVGSQTLVRLATSPSTRCGAEGGPVDVLLPRATFAALTDDIGAPRLAALDVRPGAADGDQILRSLGACLDHAVSENSGVRGGEQHIAPGMNVDRGHVTSDQPGMGIVGRLRFNGTMAAAPPPQLNRRSAVADSDHKQGSL